jgi:uncharacterized protein (DUF302 family)
MTEFTLTVTVADGYERTVERVRALLGDAGFGVLTEIDLRETLRSKLGVEVPPQVILGACRPQLAHQGLEADPRIAAMLPCNVVVASEGDSLTRVDVFDPVVMTSFSNAAALVEVAQEARERLTGMLGAIDRAVEGESGAAGA